MLIDMKNSTSYKVIKRFHSKKNEVYLVRMKKDGIMEPFIFKRYSTSKSNKEMESYILKQVKFNDLDVPKVYYEDEESILMEYIKGKTLLQIIEDLEENQKDMFNDEENKEIAFKVLNWMNNFYNILRKIEGKDMILEDINFRNFIISDKVYGIDFEDCKEGYRERDAGRFCAYLLTYNPIFSKWKIKMCQLILKILIKHYKYNIDMLLREIKLELCSIKSRRNINIPKDIIKEIT